MRMASVIFRWLLAGATAYFCVRQFAAALKTESLGAAAPLLFGFAALIATLVLIAPETVFRICGFFSRVFTGVIFPDDRASRPTLSYLLAHRYTKLMRYAEALEEYEKIIRYYPDERNAYLELLTIAKGTDNDRIYRKYARKYRKKFQCDPPANWIAPPPGLPEGLGE